MSQKQLEPETKSSPLSLPATLKVVEVSLPNPTDLVVAKSTPTMGMCHSAQCRLLSMLTLTFTFFLVELIVGYISNSTALIADSFHMLSDVVALVIAYVSIRMSPKKWSKNTFGWARAEVLGALINAVFLLALCFSIFVEALKRFVDPESLHKPPLVFAVGVIGLLVNVIGLFLFHGDGHGHSHGGHGHSHTRHEGHAKNESPPQALQEVLAADVALSVVSTVPKDDDALVPRTIVIDADSRKLHSSNGANGRASAKSDVVSSLQPKSPSKDSSAKGSPASDHNRRKKSRNMNMHGVFLHVLADALGSVIVIISALIVWFTKWEYNVYVDPALSVVMVFIIGYSTLPLLKDSALILLQTVPTHIQVDSLQRKLLQEIEGVLAVHEFHVWQLAGDRIIASAHIRCRNLHDYQQIAEKVKEFFHNEGIHSTTIQPEFVEFESENEHGFNPQPSITLRSNQQGLGLNLVGFSIGAPEGQPAAAAVPGNAAPARRYVANQDDCALDCPPGPGGCTANTCCGPQQRRTPINAELELGCELEDQSVRAKKSSTKKHSPPGQAQKSAGKRKDKQAKAIPPSSSSSAASLVDEQKASKADKKSSDVSNKEDRLSQASSSGSDTGSSSKLTKNTDNNV